MHVLSLRDRDPRKRRHRHRGGLAAAVVAPSLSAASILESLRQRVDPVFLPRPLLLVSRLPRNTAGKLPHQALEALLDQTLPAEAEVPGASKRSPHGNP